MVGVVSDAIRIYVSLISLVACASILWKSSQAAPTSKDIWVQAVGGKKKGRVKGLGSLGRSKERHKNKRMRRELDLLKKHVYNASSSNEQSSQEDNQAYENESGDDFDSGNDSGSAHDNVNDNGSAHYNASSSNGD
ncbi:hypothetical protein H5410_023222 [Solanum commersonii]|uniref:Uncharacterized protein n=1 Tax=Solanum commersonii TaxID=4109 RepID=A0A9J5ZHN7_SOLCO|nr:hypothetical protein H5410_023222 [Solanum commersonii]